MDSSFIERFGVWGMAGVLVLMAAIGLYGFASLLGVESEGPLASIDLGSEEEELADPDRTAERVRAERASAPATPAQPGETPAVSAPPGSTPRPLNGPQQVLALARDDSRPGAAAADSTPPLPPGATPAPSAGGTPLPAPGSTVPPSPAPGGPTPIEPAPVEPTPVQPAPVEPTPEPPPSTPPPPPPAECPPGGVTPQVVERNKHVWFTHGEVVAFNGASGLLVVDVGGFVLSLQVTGGTDARGDLGAARFVNGQAKWGDNGSLLAQVVEVVC